MPSSPVASGFLSSNLRGCALGSGGEGLFEKSNGAPPDINLAMAGMLAAGQYAATLAPSAAICPRPPTSLHLRY